MPSSIKAVQTAEGSLPLTDRLHIAACRQAVRRMATDLGFTVLGQTMLVTAASELARNTLVHGGGGSFSWQVLHVGLKVGLRLSFDDRGPGIPDMNNAMTNGWSSGKSMGLGLPGAKRLVHEFEIRSERGSGTHVTITRWK